MITLSDGEFVYTAKVGTNADLFPDILKIYFNAGDTIADVTYGRGVFWRNVDVDRYNLLATDINDGVDLRSLPYEDGSVDGVVLDPPYAHSSPAKLKDCMAQRYNLNSVSGLDEVHALYLDGMVESSRVLKKKGVLVLKCQDEVVSGKQRWNHILYIEFGSKKGFIAEDLFVLVQKGKPTMRHKYQVHARKNHSYFLVFRKK